MKSVLPRLSIAAFAVAVLFTACEEDGKNSSSKVDFDRKAMLEYWHDVIIVPAYVDFEAKSATFAESAQKLESGQNNLASVRNNFKALYRSFQKVKPFQIGEAQNISFKAMVNTYPTDTAKVMANLQSGNTNLDAASNIDAKGLPALDYLLFSGNNIRTDTAQQNYLLHCAKDVDFYAQKVAQDRQSSRQEFINASGTDIGSSLGTIVNRINKDYELIKNAKIGFPAGKKTFGETYPKAVEGYYSGLSLELAQANLQTIHNFYKGVSYDGIQNGPSLKDYLAELRTSASGEEEELHRVIDAQFETAQSALKQIPAPLSQAIDNSTEKVDDAYLEVQRNVRFLKVDMPSALGVVITYQDNDGD